MIELGSYKSILCLNGDLPGKDFFEKIEHGRYLVAADGAFEHLLINDIRVDAIVGDIDSIESIASCKGSLIIKNACQESTDFEKGLKHIESRDLLPAIVLGINGGSIDHVLNNVIVFSNTENIFIDKYSVVVNIKRRLEMFLPAKTIVSIFAAPYAVVSTNGLRWDISSMKMEFFGKNSVRNESLGLDSGVVIDVVDGSVIVIVSVSDWCSGLKFQP